MYKLTRKDKQFIFIKKVADFYWNNSIMIQFLLPLLFGFLLIRPFVKYLEPDFYEDEWNLYKQLNIIANPIRFLKQIILGFLAGYLWSRIFYNIINYFLKTSEYLQKNNHLIQIAKTELCGDVKDYMIDNIDVTVIKVADKYPISNDFFKERKFVKVNTITSLLELDLLSWEECCDNFLDMFYFKYNLFLDNTYYMDKSVRRLSRFKYELIEKTWHPDRIRDWIEMDINYRW